MASSQVPVMMRTASAGMTNFRWTVVAVIFFTNIVNIADRSNIGVVLPSLQHEFSITNFEAGALASFFFLGYAATQIPAGFWFSRFGMRGLIPLSVTGFSLFTFLIGTASSAGILKWFRLALGLCEGPMPVGLTGTVNAWFPGKEKSIGTSFYMAATMAAPVLVPPVSVWLLVNFGWRSIFYVFAVPGVVMAIIWRFVVHNTPRESPYCNAAEADYIAESTPEGIAARHTETKSLGWLDRACRARKIPVLATAMDVLRSSNIWLSTISYFMMLNVFYGLLTWVPSYLVTGKHFPLATMGWVAATPWIGAFIGAFVGGWVTDKMLLSRRKPTMLFAALATGIMMGVIIVIPATPAAVSIALFLSGFVLAVGWVNYTAYSMSLTTTKTYPIAIAIVNSGGNLGGFVSPLVVGALLDAYHSYNLVFGFFGIAAIVGFILMLLLDEPINMNVPATEVP